MNDDIPNVDRGDLAQWAMARMYIAMRKAEKAAADYAYNKDIIASSAPGTREIPTQDDLNTLASDNKWFMAQAEMYASIVVAVEAALSGPRHGKYQHTINAARAHMAPNKIPAPRAA